MKTNYIEQAIKKAIEGGYLSSFTNRPKTEIGLNSWYENIADAKLFLLDPSFWQSLGASLGWGKNVDDDGRDEWETSWHCFIDFLAAGKDPNDYFKEILK